MDIPPSVRKLLWEYSKDEVVAGEGWESVIIERVMQHGCWDDMRWLLQTFDRKRLRTYLERRGRRALAPRELRFWARVCEVSDLEQDSWVRESRTREQAWR